MTKIGLFVLNTEKKKLKKEEPQHLTEELVGYCVVHLAGG